jgi:hypothetical protein
VSKQPSHRGAAPEDGELYDPKHLPALRAALGDLRWLLDHGYALASSMELVGNRYELTSRQRMAVTRCACSTAAGQRRQRHQVAPEQLRGQELWLDGFNVLMAVEVALAGGVILIGCDGCCRDVAGVHARYHRVEETLPALRLIAETLTAWGVRQARWYLDSPVSNSGRLRSIILTYAASQQWNWTVDLVFNPDKVLIQSDQIIATSDSAVLDRCQRWVNLAGQIIAQRVPQARVVDLQSGHEPPERPSDQR